MVSKEEYEKLEKRVADLEKKVQSQLVDVKNQPQIHQGTVGIDYSSLGVGLSTWHKSPETNSQDL